MKTTFKKVFDEIDDEIMSIDANSICENIDIDVDRIKGEVFMRLENEKKKKRTNKKVIVMLVAAVIITFGAIGAYASGSLQYAFQGWFNGNLNASGLYDGGKVDLKNNDDSLDIKLLGVTSDDEKIFASIEVTKKDGSAVIDEDYSNPSPNINIPDVLPENANMNDYMTCRASFTDANGNAVNALSSVNYSLSEDNKALRLYISVLGFKGELQNGRVKVTSEGFSAYKKIELLDKCVRGDKESDYDYDKIEKRQKELNISDDDCFELINGKFFEYYYGDVSYFDLPFEMSFDLNYATENNIEKTLSAKDAPNLVEPIAGDTKMEITPFGIYLFGQCDVNAAETELDTEEHTMSYHCFKNVGWDDTSKVVLNDGTVFYLYVNEGGYTKTIENGDKSYYDEKMPVNYSTVIGAPIDPEYNVIDTKEIKTIMINGDVVYGK